MPINASRRIKIWLVEKKLNPGNREFEGDVTAKWFGLKKDLAVLNRKINACDRTKRMGDLWRRHYSKEMLLSQIESILER